MGSSAFRPALIAVLLFVLHMHAAASTVHVNGTSGHVAAVHWPTAYPNLTPTHVDVPWGSGPNQVLDVYAHPSGAALRSVVFFLHLGCGVASDHKHPALSGNGGGNALAWYLTEDACQQLPVKFDFVSVNYEKFDWRLPTPVTHIAPWVPTDNPVLYPENVAQFVGLFQWATAHAAEYGWDVERFHFMGASHGGVLATLARLQYAVPVKTVIVDGPIPDFRDPMIAWPVAEGFYGMPSQSSWNAIADANKETLSAILQFASGQPVNYAPMYVLNARIGDGSTPYGLWPGGSYHDIAQWHQLRDALQANVPSSNWKAESFERKFWQTATTGVAVSARVYDFMVAHE